MKVIFLGTPDFAVATLKELLASKHKVVAAVAQPDRAKDRKGNLLSTPVKQFAVANNVPFFEFEKIGMNEPVLRSLGADIMVTAAYGQILSKKILEVTPYGVVNVHASLLPKYRGSAPIQWAIINGEKETGITIMQTDVGVDSGDIISTERTLIGETEIAGELFDRLKEIGAKLLVRTLNKIEDGTAVRTPQDHSLATVCRQLKKEDGLLDFRKKKEDIVNLIRGVTPFPGAYTRLNGEIIKIGAAVCAYDVSGECGDVRVLGDKIFVCCSSGCLEILKLQLPGRKMLSAAEFLRGHCLPENTRFE